MTIEDSILKYYGERNVNENRKAEYRQLSPRLCGYRLDDVVAYVEARIADRILCAEFGDEKLPARTMAELRAAKAAAEKLVGQLHRILL